jgi:hypothetical protein
MSDNKSNESDPKNLEDIYQLAPMQQGMLFHSIYSPDSGTYFEQTLFTIKGDLNVRAFERAWQCVMDRHPILRTSFLWEDLEKPVQVVHRHLLLPVAKYDWRDLSPSTLERLLESFIEADRKRNFVLSDPPLLRLALFKVREDEHRFLFSRHHILLDRWSRALLLKDFFALYEALSRGEQPRLDVPGSYSNYIAWLAQQDAAAAERFWRTWLAGITEPSALGVDKRADRMLAGGTQYSDQRIQLSEEATEKLQTFARQHRLTLNTLAQGAWALLLSRYNGSDDVLFGVTVSGRPATLPGLGSGTGLGSGNRAQNLPATRGDRAASLQDRMAGGDRKTFLLRLPPDLWKELEKWAADPANFPNYPAGTWGPKESDQLLARDGRQWHKL